MTEVCSSYNVPNCEYVLEDERLAFWRAQIIWDVIENGLKSSLVLKREGKFYLGSADGEPCDIVHAVEHGPLDKQGYALRISLYGNNCSVLPVLAERTYYSYESGVTNTPIDCQKTTSEKLRSWEERMAASFIVVFRDGIDEVKPESFQYLLFPSDIWNQFSRTSLYTDIGTPVKVVDRRLKRGLAGKDVAFWVPDYEDALYKIMGALKVPTRIHGVRLPIEEDLARLADLPPNKIEY